MAKLASDTKPSTKRAASASAPMSAAEFTSACEALFGSVYGAAKPLGMSYTQLWRCSKGYAVHPVLSRLLRLMLARGVVAGELK